MAAAGQESLLMAFATLERLQELQVKPLGH
jgi:hypothetical protein